MSRLLLAALALGAPAVSSAIPDLVRGGCHPVVFLDGRRLSAAYDAAESVRTTLAMIPGSDVEALEVYRGPSETPGEFGGLSSRCGAIAVWSRQPRPR